MARIHVLHTEHDGQWDLSSPQLPGFRALSPTFDTPVRDSDLVIRAELGERSFYSAFWHEQHHVTDHVGDPYVIRWHYLHDTDSFRAVHRLCEALIHGHITDLMKDLQPRNVDGSRLLVLVDRDVEIGWVEDQLRPDERVSLCQWLPEGRVLVIPWGYKAGPGRITVDAELLGLTETNTVGLLEHAMFARGFGECVTLLPSGKRNGPYTPWRTSQGFSRKWWPDSEETFRQS